jgi:hypothetical protein
MRCFFLITLFLPIFLCRSQVIEQFTDGDFTNNPTWSGTDLDFSINSAQQLQLTSSVGGTSFLTTSNELSSLDTKEWHFWIKMTFSPSANNFAKVFLTATSNDLMINPDGFYLQFGEAGSLDAIRLCKQLGGISTEICSGIPGQIANSFALGVKVIRDNFGNWTLFVDSNGGENYNSSSSGVDNTSIIGGTSGIIATYTLSNSNKFYFDNFYFGDILVDHVAPTAISVHVIDQNKIDVLFDEVLDIVSAQLIGNYFCTPTIEVTSVLQDSINPKLVHLFLGANLLNGQTYSITSFNVSDLAGNISPEQVLFFTYMVAENVNLGDVILTEFMADPTPVQGLPEIEYIEIYNRSDKYFNVLGWKIGDSSADGTIQEKWLRPGEYLILCSVSSLVEYSNGVGVTSFPSLNNAGDNIVLKNNEGKVVDKIAYTDSWYKDDLKQDGGYAIERKNIHLLCSSESNWTASNAIIGGTPALVNSVNDSTPDIKNPQLLELVAFFPNTLEITFNEGMDSASLSNSFLFSPDLTIQTALISSPFPQNMTIQFNETYTKSKEYEILLNTVSDCTLNTTNLTGKFSLPETPIAGDIIINEILFDPITGGSDFIEILNRSDKTINLSNFSFGNYQNGIVSNIKWIETSKNLKAGEIMAITEDTLFLKNNYFSTVAGRLIQSDLPNYNIDSGSVYLLNEDTIIDKVSYLEKWQFKLLENSKGKSLERIDPKGYSNSENNWHTAAESVQFATPGRKNSQMFESESNGNFDFISKTISPDNDGFEDVLIVKYKMNKPGMLGTFTIFDDQGRLVNTVFKNELLATEGTFTWDGLADTNFKAEIGAYVCFFEAFEVNGGNLFNKTKAFFVAGKL